MDGIDQNVVVSPSAVRLLLLQRSQYRGPLEGLCKRLRCRGLYDHYLMGTAERLRTGRLSALFSEDLANDYAQILPALPAKASAILDVGCGLGGIDVLLSRHYEPEAVELWMLDRDTVDEHIYYGFEARTAAYSSMAETRALLTVNGVPAESVHLVDIDTEPWPANTRFDVVISLISWGFHYPVETYVDRAADSLAPGGVLILDVRSGTDGESELRRRFAEVRPLATAAKHTRYAASEPIPAQVPSGDNA